MSKKFNEFGIMLTTTISALLFCSLIIITSLSPLSELGPNANKFGSLGMWSAIGMILVLYIIPLILFKAGIVATRYIMAVFCSIGILVNITTMVTILVLSFRVDLFPYSVGITGICIAALVVNFMWFFVAFRAPKRPSAILIN